MIIERWVSALLVFKALSRVMCLRFKTNSHWTAVIVHMRGNVFMQKVFAPPIIEAEGSAWYVDEFGVLPGGH